MSLLTTKALLLAASIAIAVPLAAQQAPAPSEAPAAMPSNPSSPEKVVEGDTPDRVAQVQGCQGRKFESRVEIDAVTKRTTRIKLCANPGSSDADWVKTLEAAVAQIEQRDMPPEARAKVIGELRSEIAKVAATTSVPAPAAFVTDPNATAQISGTTDRFETSVLPPLPAPKSTRTAGAVGGPAGGANAVTAAVASQPQPPMRVELKCLDRGQTGAGWTCGFLESHTLLMLGAVEGLDAGGTLRFRRRGDIRGEVALAPMKAGRSVRVKLPAELCRGVATTKVEIELLGPRSGVVAARLGPYDLRC